MIASLKLKPPSKKMDIQKSDHDRFKLQHAVIMTAYVSYPFNIRVGNKTLSLDTFLFCLVCLFFFFHENLTIWAHLTMVQKSYKLFNAYFFVQMF